MIDLEELRKVHAFADLADDELQWLAERAEIRTFEPGEVLLAEGEPIDTMYAILEGELRFRREQGTPDDRNMVRRGGDITGMLPLSRMTHTPVTVRAVTRTRTANFEAAGFPAMLERIPELQLRLASIMVDRSREFTRHDAQREKLMSLGKLSAGLAHELNNPAAAIQQRAEALARRVDDLSAMALGGLDRSTAEALRDRVRLVVEAASTGQVPWIVDALDRSDAEEALAGWLEARGLPDPWLAAETFVATGLSAADLEHFTQGIPEQGLAVSLEWLEADLAVRRLVADVRDASRRVVELIAAVKSYSNMDRAPRSSEIDLHEGIRSTLTMLGHKLRSKDIVLRTDFGADTPHVTGNPGELNQVWTNLLDNAIDAVAPGGEITVRTSAAAGQAVVEVLDDGSGIPAEILGRIFEPFYTTKGIGEGTGLGLDVVRRIVERHAGQMQLTSEPGRTCFEVRLPAADTRAAPRPV
ncbi:MAG TPA: ATP-binding protein [Trueperaceae bacterium]|nr:ATP-binding protein [Trueperaceae bacterium]